ncbi:MAG: hypothetical protein WCW02_03560 [Candidatus Buchananbacteria bacterium]
MKNILELIYPPAEIYIVEYEFDDKDMAIKVICKVPQGSYYTAKPIPYVTAENYVRCLSQACYLLSEQVLDKKLIKTDISADNFRQAAADYELYYRNLAMTFHARVARGEEFKMRFSLKNWKEIKRINDYILFTFSNEKTVLSGEMSFVFVAKK